MKEHQHQEWKEVWRDEYLKWISAFANAEGGVLTIGRNDAGEIVGLARVPGLVTPEVAPAVTPEVGRLLVVLMGEMNRVGLMAAGQVLQQATQPSATLVKIQGGTL